MLQLNSRKRVLLAHERSRSKVCVLKSLRQVIQGHVARSVAWHRNRAPRVEQGHKAQFMSASAEWVFHGGSPRWSGYTKSARATALAGRWPSVAQARRTFIFGIRRPSAPARNRSRPAQFLASGFPVVSSVRLVTPLRSTVQPNHSLHPGPATAGGVSPACASGSIVTHRAYTACLRGPGELER